MSTLYLNKGVQKFYTSDIITGRTSEHALDIDDNFTSLGLSNQLEIPYMGISDVLFKAEWPQGIYHTTNTAYLTDGWKFNGKKLSKTTEPKDNNSAKVSLCLLPENSCYIGRYCAVVIDCYIDVYKLLGGRHFCTQSSIHWIKGNTTKLGLQLQVSALKYGDGSYEKLRADFLRSPYNKIEAIKLLHMTLASYGYVTNLFTDSDALCEEFADLIYHDVVLPWKSDAPASIISTIKTEWLKPELIL